MLIVFLYLSVVQKKTSLSGGFIIRLRILISRRNASRSGEGKKECEEEQVYLHVSGIFGCDRLEQ
ncbi:hypothetical protein [Izhakiella australiensis]|uniref:hypothetical protein n=1 Tax=Izhakiella australiensis TaxID=1926881 RepID=UPI0011159E49|nr:hypothetical protein [Izhakiella australiensis]